MRIMGWFVGAISVAAASACPAAAQTFFEDGNNFVYREEQSCALYVDLADEVMFRLSYRRHSRETFLSIVGGPWDSATVGDMYLLGVESDHEPGVRQTFPAQGIIQPGQDPRKGLAGSQGDELLELFRSTSEVRFYESGEFLAAYQLSNMPTAIDKLMTCSMAHFGTAP